jgi:hypothetical protein
MAAFTIYPNLHFIGTSHAPEQHHQYSMHYVINAGINSPSRPVMHNKNYTVRRNTARIAEYGTQQVETNKHIECQSNEIHHIASQKVK